MSDKPRYTRTTRHFTKSTLSDGDVFTTRAGNDPTFVPRLSWSLMLEKAEYNAADLCAGIARAADVAFFCDTSIFDDRALAELWLSLFDSRAEIFLTPRVEQELAPWLDKRPDHPVNGALKGGRIKVRSVAEWSDAEQHSFIHYTNILGLRKRMMGWGELEFERQHGREATEKDISKVRAIVQRAVGERGFLFAKKGAAERAKKGTLSFADEELVYTSVADALRSGRQTIILTKDEDLLDQFYRLVYLIDSNYRSMLIARRYVDDFAWFRSYPIPTRNEWAEAFVPGSGVLVECHQDLPHLVLPTSFQFVAVSAWLIGERHQALTFGAETAINRLLEVKGRTRGMNTDRLGSRNCHLAVSCFSSPGPGIPMCFAVAEDHTVNIAGQNIPWLELNHGAMGVERFKRMRHSPFVIP